MGVVHVADAAVGPAARRIDQPRRVALPQKSVDFRDFVLTPAFVERHPHHDRREEREAVDQLGQLALELHGGILRALGIQGGLRGHAQIAWFAPPQVAVRHVLPDQQPETVAMVVPAGRLDLDMLARGVEAEHLGHLDVVAQRFVGRSRVQSVRPPALVQGTEHEQRLAIEKHPRESAGVLAKRDVAEREVAAHAVEIVLSPSEGHVKVVQIRLVRGPQLRILHRELDGLSGLAARLPHQAAVAVGREPHGAAIALPAGRDPNSRRPSGAVGLDGQRGHRRRRHGLQPDRLPDSRDGGVPDSTRFAHLLPAGLRPRVRRVPD